MSTALLYSGGLDSTCAFFILHKPNVLFCGGPYGPARQASMGELKAVQVQQQLSPELRNRFTGIIADFTPFMRKDEWGFPRDQVCAMRAWAHGYNGLLLGLCQDDRVTAETVDAHCRKIEGAVDARGFKVDAPLWNMTKAEMVSHALALGAPLEVLHASHSCVKRADVHCGECINCCERWVAFR